MIKDQEKEEKSSS